MKTRSPRFVVTPAALLLIAACAAEPGETHARGEASGGAGGAATARDPAAVVQSLLDADNAFSEAAAQTDAITALVAMFAEDVIMQVPGGTFARGRAAAADSLRASRDLAQAAVDWRPVRGGIAADGRHGFTFGYMTVRAADQAVTPLKYMAYWVRQPEGWRVVVYKRARAGPGDADPMQMGPVLPVRMVEPVTDAAAIAGFRESLAAAEREFSDEAQRSGLGAAFARYGSPDAVNMGGADQAGYIVGAEAIGRSIDPDGAGGSPVSWAPETVIVASSGDLGVSIGYIRLNSPPAEGAAGPGIPFFTIWRRPDTASPWRYIAE
jgi:ketosteroid isomerase-like protein